MHYFASVSLADEAGFTLANFFAQSEFLLNSHWLATFFEVKEVGSNPTFYSFQSKEIILYEKIFKWKTSFKIRYVNNDFVNFIQISTASCI